MKDDEIFIPFLFKNELKYLVSYLCDKAATSVCDGECNSCAFYSVDNFKKWQEQCKDK